MKLSLFSVVALAGFTIAAGSHQATNNQAKREIDNPDDGKVWANGIAAVKRQDAAPALNQPAMTDANGNVVPFSNAGAAKANAKRQLSIPADDQVWASGIVPVKRQAAVEQAAMTDASGNVVPFSNAAKAKRQDAAPPLNQPAMTDANGNVVPFSNAGVAKARAKRAAMAQQKRTAEGMKARQASREARQMARRHADLW